MIIRRKEVFSKLTDERRCFVCNCVLKEENVLFPEMLEELEEKAFLALGSLTELEQLALDYGICLECFENGEIS